MVNHKNNKGRQRHKEKSFVNFKWRIINYKWSFINYNANIEIANANIETADDNIEIVGDNIGISIDSIIILKIIFEMTDEIASPVRALLSCPSL